MGLKISYIDDDVPLCCPFDVLEHSTDNSDVQVVFFFFKNSLICRDSFPEFPSFPERKASVASTSTLVFPSIF